MYIRSSFEPGGIESLLVNVFNFKQDTIEFHYVLLKDGSLIEDLTSSNNKKYLFFRKRKYDFKVLWSMYKVLKTENIKIVHAHQLIEYIYALALKIAIPSIKIYRTLHGYQSRKFMAFIERNLLITAEKNFTVSNAAREQFRLRGYNSKRMEILYNAVPMPSEIKEDEKVDFYEHIKYSSGDFILAMIGNFVWWKDQLTIIKAFERISKKYPKAKIVFFGNSDTELGKASELAAGHLLNKQVFILGSWPNASKYLKLFNGFIFSSIDDTFGIALVEAMLCKIPILASDIGVCKELSKNGLFFDLFQTGSVDSLEEGLRTLLEANYDSSRKEAAFEHSQLCFSINTYFNNLNKYYA